MSILTSCTEYTATKPSTNNSAVPLSSAPRTDQEQLTREKAASKDDIQVMLGLMNTEPSPHTGGGVLELWAHTTLCDLLAQFLSVLKELMSSCQ